MTEMELKLLLAKYNILSRERAKAAYMWRCTGESLCYEAKWSKCVDEMEKMRDDLRECGYKFDYTDSKVADRLRYNVYKIVPVNDEE